MAEVRVAAAGKAGEFCSFVGGSLTLKEILPSLTELSNDTSQHVRAAIATVVMVISPIFGNADTVEASVLPIILTLLRDEYPDVRLNIISNLEQVSKIIGIQLLQKSLLPAIVALAEDRHWRVRLAIIEYFPQLAGKLGIEWLKDQVHAIRQAAAMNLKKLSEQFGEQWTQEFVLPKILDMVDNPHYLYRMAVLEALAMV